MSIMVGNTSGSPFTASTAGTAAAKAAEEAKRLDDLRLGQGELNDFAAHLSKLRDLLARLQKVPIRTSAEPGHSPASVYSPASLGLDFAAGDDTAPIASVAALSGVASGTFEVNGVSIAVDVTADSLADLANRITASGAGVTAELNDALGGLVLTADDRDQPLALADGSSGFFTALAMGAGTHGAPTRPVRTFSRPEAVEHLLQDVGRELDTIFRGDFERLDEDLLEEARGDLETSIRDALKPILGESTADRLRSGFGLDFDFADGSQKVFTFESRPFHGALGDRFEDLADFLFHEGTGSESSGFVPTLMDKLDELAGSLVEDLAGSLTQGALADVSA